jgi:hypothetical protein
MKKVIIFIFIAIYLIGCNLIQPPVDGKTEIIGKIINESTGEVVPNISLILVKGIGSGFGYGGGGYKTVAQSNTNVDGNFNIYYDAGDDQNLLAFFINKEPYNDLYSLELLNITPGTRIKNKVYSVYQNTTLKVTLNSQFPLEPRTYTLLLPGIGTSIDTVLVTTRAKGNFYNIVKLNYTIENSNFEIIDSVYCPINTITNYVLNL